MLTVFLWTGYTCISITGDLADDWRSHAHTHTHTHSRHMLYIEQSTNNNLYQCRAYCLDSFIFKLLNFIEWSQSLVIDAFIRNIDPDESIINSLGLTISDAIDCTTVASHVTRRGAHSLTISEYIYAYRLFESLCLARLCQGCHLFILL